MEELISNVQSDLGKKVIFLYPQSVIQENLVTNIMRNEYEVYLLHDHEKNRRIIKKYNNSIVFINIDSGLSEPEWEKYIREIRTNDDTKNVQIGILSYNENRELAQKYLMDIGVQCGFIRLKIGIKESTDIIIKTLEANEAKGKRKYVRVSCRQHNIATFNVKLDDNVYTGNIMDISSVGMAITFNENIAVDIKTVLSDIQLRLRGIICMVTGVVIAVRKSTVNTYVVMFIKNLKPDIKNKIYHFIHTVLQESIADI